MRRFLEQYWFLLSLVALLLVGTQQHTALTPLAKQDWLRDGNLFVVMLVMVLPLKFGELWNTVRRPFAPGLAIAISYGLAPLLATFIAPRLGNELGPGLLVAAALPCTMASAAVWTRRAGGNDAIALCVTAVTNFFCFLVFPLLFGWMFRGKYDASQLDLSKLSQQLMWLVVVPIIIGQLLRLTDPIARFAEKHRQGLSNFTQCGVLLQVFLGAIQLGNKWAEPGSSRSTMPEFLAMVAAVTGLHLFLFFVGYTASKLFRFSRRDSIAVGFSGSQKTLMVGLQVAHNYGFSILPLVCYHVLQLFYDTLIAEHFRRMEPEEEQATPPAPETITTDETQEQKVRKKKRASMREELRRKKSRRERKGK